MPACAIFNCDNELHTKICAYNEYERLFIAINIQIKASRICEGVYKFVLKIANCQHLTA